MNFFNAGLLVCMVLYVISAIAFFIISILHKVKKRNKKELVGETSHKSTYTETDSALDLLKMTAKTSDQVIVNSLAEVRKLIERPEHWTQMAYARDADGKRVGAISPEATCWCLAGAVQKVTVGKNQDVRLDTMKTLGALSGEDSASVYNDTHAHHEVIGMVDSIIAAKQAKIDEAIGRFYKGQKMTSIIHD